MEKFTLYIDKNIGKVTGYIRSRDTRNGFAHDCVIPQLGIKVTSHFSNRTWESFFGQSTIHSAIDKIVRNTLNLKGKKNEKLAEAVYRKLCIRVDKLHNKRGFKHIASEYEIFG